MLISSAGAICKRSAGVFDWWRTQENRASTRGVPVLCNGDHHDFIYELVRKGLSMVDRPEVSLDQTCKVIYYTDYGIPGKVGEGEVSTWLAGHHKGEEERDLLTDRYCSRGWEAMTVMVINLGGYAGAGVENLVMRGRTCVALVTDQE